MANNNKYKVVTDHTNCGRFGAGCRKKISNNDVADSSLWKRYYFSLPERYKQNFDVLNESLAHSVTF